jgi:hypothetical protein
MKVRLYDPLLDPWFWLAAPALIPAGAALFGIVGFLLYLPTILSLPPDYPPKDVRVAMIMSLVASCCLLVLLFVGAFLALWRRRDRVATWAGLSAGLGVSGLFLAFVIAPVAHEFGFEGVRWLVVVGVYALALGWSRVVLARGRSCSSSRTDR